MEMERVKNEYLLEKRLEEMYMGFTTGNLIQNADSVLQTKKSTFPTFQTENLAFSRVQRWHFSIANRF